MFVDYVTVHIKAGDGGRGFTSFRKEKFVDRGGPDGGDGGHGGNVVFEARENVNTLAQFRYDKEVRAESGEPGGKQNRRGKSADDTFVYVPVGTVLREGEDVLADLRQESDSVVIAKGGEGGFGNAHFKSSTRQAPRVSELGTPGEEKELILELKLVADVGLVGLPNAGKSTFLSVISNARPKIANYPFTTLQPNLGVADVGKKSLVVADIPGLIEGASEGKGLGDDFLRHVERTSVLLHLIDVSDDVVESFRVISQELSEWKELHTKPRIVSLSKVDTVTEKEVAKKTKQLEEVWDGKIWHLASTAHKGLNELLYELVRTAEAEEKARQEAEQELEDEEAQQSTVYTLEAKPEDWTVTRAAAHHFRVEGENIERFAQKTDANSWAAVERLFDILKKQGVMHQLRRQGYESGDIIEVAGRKFQEEA